MKFQSKDRVIRLSNQNYSLHAHRHVRIVSDGMTRTGSMSLSSQVSTSRASTKRSHIEFGSVGKTLLLTRRTSEKDMVVLESWLCIPIVLASKAEASEVSSHFVVVQEQIDHVEQQAQHIPNRQDVDNSLTDWPVHEDKAINVYGGRTSERYTEHDDHVPQEMQVAIADRSSLTLARSRARLNSARRRAYVREDHSIADHADSGW